MLASKPPAETLRDLHHPLQESQHAYNTKRTHRSLDGHTPERAYHATIKARPHTLVDTTHSRIRIDETTVTVTELTTEEDLSQHLIGPERHY